MHAAAEPLVAIVLIAGPWIFGFNDIESLTIVSVVVGVVMLMSGMMTRWRYSIAKVISLRMHFATDLLLGAVLIVSPFIAGWDGRGDATRFLVIMGALELLVALATRWDLREELAPRRHETGRTAGAR
jgi:hypothetical protein